MEKEAIAKKKREIPDSLVIIIIVMLLAAVLTYIIPSGEYTRTVNEAGQTVVDPDSFHYLESTPVNPLTVLNFVYKGLDNARGIIWVLLCSGGGLGLVLSTGLFQGVAATMSKKAKGKEWMVIGLVSAVFCVLCIPINLNAFIPLAPLGLLIATSMGMDAIVGVSMILLGGAIGFSCGAMNVSNTGTAQQVAELATFSGMGYRLICMIPFYIVTVAYIIRYAYKVKANPQKSYMYGVDMSGVVTFDPDKAPKLEKKHILPGIITLVGLLFMIYKGVEGKLTNPLTASIFMYMGLLVGISYHMSPNEICKEFMKGVKGMCGTAMMIGFAYVISVILNQGQILDTIVNFLAGVLIHVPKLIQAPLMFYAHIIINLFITSGSGQAATTMPIFVPVADLVGMTRQTAVLAFNFGDGFCNFILPHAAATMGFVGALGIPFGKWFKYAIKLFAIWVVIGSILLMIATGMNYS